MKISKRQTRLFNKTLLIFFMALILSGVTWMSDTLTTVDFPAQDSTPKFYSTHTNDDLQLVYSKAILEAKKSIVMVIYAMTDLKVIKALNTKAEEGLNVFILFDGKACKNVAQKLSSKIKIVKRFGRGLSHQKLLVIDDSQVWIGSANMTTESLRMHGNLVTAVDHTALASFISQRAYNLPEEGSAPEIRHRKFLARDQQLEMWFLPNPEEGPERIKELLDTAQKTIKVAMFTFTRTDFADSLVKAKDRGVDVEVVLDYNSGRGASSGIFQRLKSANVPIYLSERNGLLHDKFVYIDSETLAHGSANWTKAAFTQNDDCFIVLNKLSDEQKGFMEDLWKNVKEESR